MFRQTIKPEDGKEFYASYYSLTNMFITRWYDLWELSLVIKSVKCLLKQNFLKVVTFLPFGDDDDGSSNERTSPQGRNTYPDVRSKSGKRQKRSFYSLSNTEDEDNKWKRQRLWLSWHSGRHPKRRSTVQIHSSAKFYIKRVFNACCCKDKNKKWPI